MQDSVRNTVAITCAIVVVLFAWKLVNLLWVRPKKLEKYLRNQGLKGNKYRLLYGDMKEFSSMVQESKSKPISLDDDDGVLTRVVPFTRHSLQKHGKNFIIWMGWKPTVSIMDPDLIKDVFVKSNDFQKLEPNPVSKFIATGLVAYEGDQWAKHRKLINPAFHMEKLKEALMSVYIPGSRFFPTKRNRRLNAIDRKLKDSIRGIINKKLKAMEAGEGNNGDLLGIMLESNIKEVEEHQNKNHGMTIDEVIEECKIFYFAGQDTTSGLLVWTMILLSKHQDWQSRAREEVLNVLGDKNMDLNALNHLKVVNMIFHEVLRLYPPIIGLFRRVKKDVTLGRFSLPSGTQIELPIMSIHYDKEIWGGDANKFNPDRFSEGVSKATKNQVIYLPFGWGPRICIGQNFALIEAKIALAMILQRFSFELSPSYVHAPHKLLTLHPQYGAHLIMHKLE
ncbi:hypothetical protein L1887_08019 [Cichorium endivia]|nr:hypothetical protein L1887_08019 [Cichorium endivia]